MAERSVHIEFVPFPDIAEPVEDVGNVRGRTMSDTLGGVASGDPAEPPVGTDAEKGADRSTRQRAGDVTQPGPNVTDEIVVERDESSLRTTSISGRLLLLTLGAVLLAAVVAVASVAGVALVSDAGRQVAELSDAREANSEVIAALRVFDATSTSESSSSVVGIRDLAVEAAESAAPWVDGELADRAVEATEHFIDTRLEPGTNAGSAQFDDAIEARTQLDAALRDVQLTTVERAESRRTAAIAAVMVLFAVGSVALVVMGRVIGRSVVAPLRSLGRTLRRFGDGDLRSRSDIAGDEVGTLARSFNSMADSVSARVLRLNADAERDSQLRMVGDALDLADRESDVYRILEEAFAALTPANPAELLVNEPTSTRLWQVSVNPTAGAGGCPVETAEGCVAMRRAQAMVWDGPGAINACPQLRAHAAPCSAACVPVGVNGHLLGVMHVTAPEHEPPPPELVGQLVKLGGQVGGRVGAQRTLETTRLQASTDGLTGLANRRMLEARLGDLLRGQVSFALAVADVDHFKRLNDTYGHETGDRALQLFAKVLEDNVRGHDVVARYGGEEFVLVYPELSVKKAMEVIERIRSALERAIAEAGLPAFTCSFGVTHSSSAGSVDAIIRIADAGLFMAKDMGRNRVVFADPELAAKVFDERAV